MEKNDIAQLFIQVSRGEEISPALYNGAIFIQSSGWNTRKYFEKYYDNDGSFPIIITMNSKEGIYYYHFSQAKKHAEEIFIKHWDGQNILEQRFQNFQKLSDQTLKIYEKLTYSYINSKQENKIIDDVIAIKDIAWEINASLFFSIAFDEDLCTEFLEKVQSNITPDRVRLIWEKATQPIFHSLDTRRKHIVLEMIKKGFSWEEMGERCQFFNASYSHVKNPPEVMLDLRKEFGEYKPNKIDDILRKDDTSKKIKHQKYTQWIKTLSAQETKLVEYIQAIMKLRDIRKDPMAQAVAVMYRFAQKIFSKCSIEEKYIFYTNFYEVLKGSQYINSIRDKLQKRFPEYCVFVDRDGLAVDETGIHESAKEQISAFYLEQQSFQKSQKDIVRGFVGSPGKIRGSVRIIRSYKTQKDSFLENEILVTGMTRPEFVPLMKKASAIITDEGGITCHAAIISRELKKPCIIGTKIATQVLKDGDLVEVDADKGIVRIIK